MKRTTFLYILIALFALSCKAQPKHELRAAWLTTVGGLDWPHNYAQSTKSIRRQQEELCRTLDLLKEAHVNTVLFQTRIRGTVIYPSTQEPWDGCTSGNPGQNPGYDPLQFAIDECHRRGMELHAWVVTIPIGKWNGAGARNLMRRNPRLVKRIGDEAYMNPEAAGTADYLADLCGDITKRYDVDGIHLDYIRYPETWKININRQTGRTYITRIAQAISQRVKSIKPWVKMSCSPIGKYKDLDRQESYGWNAYTRVCQDAQQWLRDGIMDQLYPMMYFDGKHFYPFASDWSDNRYDGQTAAGLGIYMLSPKERNWSLSAVERQMNVARQMGLGHAYFRTKFLTDNVKGIYDFVCRFDATLALTPALKTSTPAPAAPQHFSVTPSPSGYRLSWAPVTSQHPNEYIVYTVYASTHYPVNTNDANNIVAIRWQDTTIEIKRQKTEAPLHFAVSAVDRYGQESQPAQPNRTTAQQEAKTSLLDCDGTTLHVPTELLTGEITTIAICSMQGQTLATHPADTAIPVGFLPDGVYEVVSPRQHDNQQHIGYFVIRKGK